MSAEGRIEEGGRGAEPRVLVITPCHNDGWALDDLAGSLASQKLQPTRWLVVDDSSTDDTPDVLARLEETVPYMTGHRRDREPGRRIAEKARAIMATYRTIDDRPGYDYVAIVDADVVLPANYLEAAHRAMVHDPSLGVTGGMYHEVENGRSLLAGRSYGGHVPGPAQVFRREVFDLVDGYQPWVYGGDDVVSVTKARMLGYRTGADPDVTFTHARRMGTAGHGSPVRAAHNLGRQDHDLGTWWFFELVKLVRALGRRPYGLVAAARAAGFVELKARRHPPSVDTDYITFVRDEQRRRVRAGVRRFGWRRTSGQTGGGSDGSGPSLETTPSRPPAADVRWVAVTPAYNESAHIPGLYQSMLAQDRRPDAWVIANDGSTDGTGGQARSLASAEPWIGVIDVDRSSGRHLSSKAGAVAAAYAAAIERCPDAAFVLSVDADVELPPHAFSFLLERFEDDPSLGIAGGVYLHPVNGARVAGRLGPNHVPGPMQMFRREVFEAIGGYRPMADGGLDTVANAHARMLGWRTRAFDQLRFSHNRRMGTGGDRHPLVAEFHGGRRDRSLGAAVVFEMAKCVRRLGDPPIIIGSLARFAGFGAAVVTRRPSDVPPDIAHFIRREQLARLVPFRSGR